RYVFQGIPVVISRSRSRTSLLRQAKAAVDAQLVADFSLDNGVPYLRGNNSFAVMIADEWAEQFEETSKAVIAAAFAGISIAPSADSDVLNRFMHKIPMLRKAKYEDYESPIF